MNNLRDVEVALGGTAKGQKLRRNRIKCLECGDIIESHSRWDYNICDCPNKAMVDGGLEYERYGAVDMDKIETMIEYVEADVFLWGVLTPEGHDRKPLGELSDSHIQNIVLHLRTRYIIRPEDEETISDSVREYAGLKHASDMVLLRDHLLPELERRGLEEVTEEIPHE